MNEDKQIKKMLEKMDKEQEKYNTEALDFVPTEEYDGHYEKLQEEQKEAEEALKTMFEDQDIVEEHKDEKTL